jgi:hypothetical protein
VDISSEFTEFCTPTRHSPSPELRERYGHTRRSKIRDKWLIGSIAAAFVMVFGAWVLWVGLDGTTPAVDAHDIGHTIIDDRTVEVVYDISLPPGENAACALQALNENFSIVGWKIVQIPASVQRVQSFTSTIRTIEPSNTALIYRCWLV